MTYVLIIDDEPKFAEPAKRVLAKEGFEVDLAYSIDEARESINNRKPDGIILDVLFRHHDAEGMVSLGIEFLKMLKNDDQTKGIPVVMYTVVFDSHTEQICRDVGAVGYLRKSAGGQKILAEFRKAGIAARDATDGDEAHFSKALVKHLESYWMLYRYRYV